MCFRSYFLLFFRCQLLLHPYKTTIAVCVHLFYYASIHMCTLGRREVANNSGTREEKKQYYSKTLREKDFK